MHTDFIVDDEPLAQPRTRPPHRPGTIAWGVAVVALGAGVLAVACGVQFSPFALLIMMLGLIGIVALLLALIPRPAAPVVAEVEPVTDKQAKERWSQEQLPASD